MAGIPTLYGGRRFRSRLEARWAAFFDLLGWPYEYEPIDLDGYIPDFVLCFPRPVLVEVKQEFTVEDLGRHGPRIDRSGWRGPALLVGARMWRFADSRSACTQAEIGLGNTWLTGYGDGWDAMSIGSCAGGHPSLASETGGWQCWVCGASGKSWYLGFQDLDVEGWWTAAGNTTQWKGQAPR